jgi:hypothetical protein
MDDEEIYEHESYGMVGFHRVSHGPGKSRLFGSSITKHYSTVMLRIRPAQMSHHLSSDHYFGKSRTHIEVELTATQFAELLTTMNVGDGVPCTVRRLNGKLMEDPPGIRPEAERVRDGFGQKMIDLTTRTRAAKRRVMEILAAKKAPNKHDRREIAEAFEQVVQELESNIPFVADQFQEATDRIVTAGKAEIDSFVTTMVQTTGLTQLQEMAALQLEEPESEEELED